MERCHPHVIMRRGMMQGIVYPAFAEQIADYLAAALYFTSDLAMPAVEKKALIAAFCGNTDLCRITEDLVFTDPYMVCGRNRWTSPQLDQQAASIRDDAELKRAVSALKLKFLGEAQALLHGDLHTGSIMVTEQDTKVIDPEFAFVGPMGFDVGKLLGELLLSFFSQRGHETSLGQRDSGAIAPAVVGCAKVGAALHHLARDRNIRHARVAAPVALTAARIVDRAAGMLDLAVIPIPVGGPFPDVAGHIMETIAIRRK